MPARKTPPRDDAYRLVWESLLSQVRREHTDALSGGFGSSRFVLFANVGKLR